MSFIINTRKMKRIFTAAILIVLLGFSSTAQKKKEILVTIGETPVTLSDFMRIYERNNSNIQDPANKKSAAEYLQLYINFKLKVLEAQRLGLDTASTFKSELAGYRTELAAPYLTDIPLNEKVVEETYHRMRKEVNAAHIMIAIPENQAPDDTLAAWNRITTIREEVVNGLDFNEAALKYSQDPSAQSNKGELGWFSVFQMVYPFEEAAFTTPPGEITGPVRTGFGYHLIKVNGIRDAGGELQVAHIMKVYPQNASPEQKEKARAALDSLYQLILKGEDFGRLAREASDDQRSAVNNGEMPWFSKGRMVPAFADPAFALTRDGEVSKPVDSGFGYHIIKRLGFKPVPEFQEVKRELEERIKRDQARSTRSRELFLTRLKKEYNFTRNQESIDKILLESAKWFESGKPNIPENPENSAVLFSFASQKLTPLDWVKYLRHSSPAMENGIPGDLPAIFHQWENETLLAYEESQLESKHPEFRSLLEEYHDGILLFNISESKIWQQASADTAGLLRFYETNKQKYLWPERVKGMIVRSPYPQIREEIERHLEAGIPATELHDLMHMQEGTISVTEGSWAKNENPIVDYYFWNGPKPDNWSNESGFVRGKIVVNEPKTLDEARGYHIADYQQYLEEAWIRELREKYPVKINKKLYKQLADE